MQVNPDPQLQAAAVQALRDEYNLGTPRGGIHQSQLSHCLTRSFYDATDPEPITEKLVMYYAIGFAMERVIFDRGHEQAIVVDGITLSLDDITKFGGGVDLKTTRKAANGRKGEDGFQFPETWERQFAAYVYGLNQLCECGHVGHQRPDFTSLKCETDSCLCRGFKQVPPAYDFGVIVIHLVSAELRAYRVTYTHNELVENWAWLLTRYDQYLSMLAANDPQPFLHNESYECSDCPYYTRCALTASIKELEGA